MDEEAERRRVFEDLVAQAIDELPEEFRDALSNVAFIVEDEPPDERLLGLYEGVPQTRRSPLGYSLAMPDRITIYRRSIEAHAMTPADLARAVRHTVFHEVAHHFGISDERLRELGAY